MNSISRRQFVKQSGAAGLMAGSFVRPGFVQGREGFGALRLQVPRLEHRDNLAGAHDLILQEGHLFYLRADLGRDVGFLAGPDRADGDNLRGDTSLFGFGHLDADHRRDFGFVFRPGFSPAPDDEDREREHHQRDRGDRQNGVSLADALSLAHLS